MAEGKKGLRAKWSRRDKDILYHFDAGCKPDGSLTAYALEQVKIHNGKSWREEMTSRGYDITTMKLSINKLS